MALYFSLMVLRNQVSFSSYGASGGAPPDVSLISAALAGSFNWGAARHTQPPRRVFAVGDVVLRICSIQFVSTVLIPAQRAVSGSPARKMPRSEAALYFLQMQGDPRARASLTYWPKAVRTCIPADKFRADQGIRGDRRSSQGANTGWQQRRSLLEAKVPPVTSAGELLETPPLGAMHVQGGRAAWTRPRAWPCACMHRGHLVRA